MTDLAQFDFLGNLAARNVPGAPASLPVVQPRLRSRFEPPNLAEAPAVNWKMEVMVEREPPAAPSRGRVHPRSGVLRDESASLPPSETQQFAARPASQPMQVPSEPPPERTVTRLERIERIEERVEPSTATQPTKVSPQVSESRADLHAVLQPQGPQDAAPLESQAEGPETEARPVEPAEAHARIPWAARPQATRLAAPSEPPHDAALPPSPPEAAPVVLPAAPPVQVTIGRLEVRALPPSRPAGARGRPAHSGQKAQSGLSLGEYLRKSGRR